MGGSLMYATYFRRFYGSRRSRVYSGEQVDQLARGVTGFVQWFGGEIESVLDVGAGTGLWGAWFRAQMPGVDYRAIDVSEYACATYGHERKDISSWRGRKKHDLVVCQGVLPYLDDEACARAISRTWPRCAGGFSISRPSQPAISARCADRKRTDIRMRGRPAAPATRRALAKHFERVGCGLHHVRGGDKVFYELERG